MKQFSEFWYCQVFCVCIPTVMASTLYNVMIDASNDIGNVHHFWRSTGMCPPLPHERASEYFLSEDMFQNLALIGSVPHSGIQQVRMHWLLDMVEYDKDKKIYNFTNLDVLFQKLQQHNLNPGFELMGSPSKYFTDFDDHDQVNEWMDLITTIAKRYVTMFGVETVSEWNFETWNEPDHKDFDDVNMSVEGFLKYYDACSEGLKAADKSLRFGGPGGSCRKESFSKRCWGLLDHCVNGRNYITGEKGSRIDYISMHKKGGGSSSYILNSEIETITKIHSLHPSLDKTPIYNDEGDPMVGWSKPYPWRGDATYPAVVAKIIGQHQYGIIINRSSSVVYELLSDDNGFLSYSPHYFNQRTLNARFQMNNTLPKYVHLVRKPIHSVMVLLSKLGNKQIDSFVKSNSTYRSGFGVVASKCSPNSGPCASKEISVLTYLSNDTAPTVNEITVVININNIKSDRSNNSSTAMVRHCVIDNKFTNPAQVWESAGKPDFPSPDLFIAMHNASGPYCFDPVRLDIMLGSVSFDFELRMPGVSLHHICWMPPASPKPPTLISVTNITSGQVLITWSDSGIDTKCIDRFKIQLCLSSECAAYRSIADEKIASNSYVYIEKSGVDKDVRGMYRMMIVDFWGRSSKFSNIITY